MTDIFLHSFLQINRKSKDKFVRKIKSWINKTPVVHGEACAAGVLPFYLEKKSARKYRDVSKNCEAILEGQNAGFALLPLKALCDNTSL